MLPTPYAQFLRTRAHPDNSLGADGRLTSTCINPVAGNFMRLFNTSINIMNAELLLSRTAYKAGTPVVGTVRIRSDADEHASESSTKEISTAHLYLTGQAHLRPGSSSWRSSKEISKLKSLYGEHACLTFASLQERKRGDEKLTLIEQADRVALNLRMHNRNEFRSELPINESYYGEEDVICYWMTNVIDLMNVAEDAVGEELLFSEDSNVNEKEKNSRDRYYLPRKPLKLPDYNILCQLLNTTADALHDRTDDDINSLGSSDDSDSCDDNKLLATKISDQSTWDRIMASAKFQPDDSSRLQQKALLESQLAITFRSNLPEDVPPTITTECVKYFYSAVLVVTTTNDEVIIKDCPFSVLTSRSMIEMTHPRSNHTSSTRVHIGELYAKVHSTSLPCELSSIEALGERQLHVISDPPACSIVSRTTAESRTSTHRIQNENGALCAWITLVGVGGPIVPGSRLSIVVRFPELDDDNNTKETGLLPCHRVCCALVGEEYALCEGAEVTTSSIGPTKKRKTRSYVFDSTYELVEFGYTNSVSMGLLLPSDCPVAVKTDLVEVTVSLKLEFTVDQFARHEVDYDVPYVDSTNPFSGFGVIRLDLPVVVVHEDGFEDEDEEDEMTVQSQMAAISRYWKNDTDSNKFDESGVREDLRELSLKLLGV